ncbi:hypothetical protein AAAV51_00950, partial [Agathobaculum butyriciproducens]|uniref:hypothetical protein n=1 Tax=Agathobaculum butyriciproducens TaxID=1628085 RepID=UPI0032BFB087
LESKLSSNLQVVSSRSCFPPMTCIGFDKEMKMKCCYSPSDVIRGRVAGRMKKLITKDQHTYFLRQRQG